MSHPRQCHVSGREDNLCGWEHVPKSVCSINLWKLEQLRSFEEQLISHRQQHPGEDDPGFQSHLSRKQKAVPQQALTKQKDPV